MEKWVDLCPSLSVVFIYPSKLTVFVSGNFRSVQNVVKMLSFFKRARASARQTNPQQFHSGICGNPGMTILESHVAPQLLTVSTTEVNRSLKRRVLIYSLEYVPISSPSSMMFFLIAASTLVLSKIGRAHV